MIALEACEGNTPGHAAAFINSLKLSELRSALAKHGLNTEFNAGALECCNGTIAIRRVGSKFEHIFCNAENNWKCLICSCKHNDEKLNILHQIFIASVLQFIFYRNNNWLKSCTWVGQTHSCACYIKLFWKARKWKAHEKKMVSPGIEHSIQVMLVDH